VVGGCREFFPLVSGNRCADARDHLLRDLRRNRDDVGAGQIDPRLPAHGTRAGVAQLGRDHELSRGSFASAALGGKHVVGTQLACDRLRRLVGGAVLVGGARRDHAETAQSAHTRTQLLRQALEQEEVILAAEVVERKHDEPVPSRRIATRATARRPPAQREEERDRCQSREREVSWREPVPQPARRRFGRRHHLGRVRRRERGHGARGRAARRIDRVHEVRRRGVPLVRLLGQRLLHQHVEVGREVGAHLRDRDGPLGEALGQDRARVLPGERRLAVSISYRMAPAA
jgi:hypothetical protein